ncbi:MAG: hypothetical protein ABWZ26_03020 [Candidatus Nanopelagicales bacterium]
MSGLTFPVDQVGVLRGPISYAFSGGRRDFVSTTQLVASRHDLERTLEMAPRAQQVLSRLSGSAGTAPPTGAA